MDGNMNNMVAMATKDRDLHILDLTNQVNTLTMENKNLKNQIYNIGKVHADRLFQLKEKQELINQLHMEIEGLKGLIFPEVKNKKLLNFKLFGVKINIEKCY
jgi:hypothetical protein